MHEIKPKFTCGTSDLMIKIRDWMKFKNINGWF